MVRKVTTGIVMALMLGAFSGSSIAEPFFVEMRDGTFIRCGNLDYKEQRKEWRLRGCGPISALFESRPVETPRPTFSPRPEPTFSSRPIPTATEFCAGGTIEWDPITRTTRCVRGR